MTFSFLMSGISFSTPLLLGIGAGYSARGITGALVGAVIGAAFGGLGIASTRLLTRLGNATAGPGKQGGTLPSLWDALSWVIAAGMFVAIFGIAWSDVLVVQSALQARGSDLRGWWTVRQDGKTYLTIDDDNGGGCGDIFVDQKKWTAAIHEKGPIIGGRHKIDCGNHAQRGGIEFDVREGTSYHFNDWGP
jgi:hypothetical protein